MNRAGKSQRQQSACAFQPGCVNGTFPPSMCCHEQSPKSVRALTHVNLLLAIVTGLRHFHEKGRVDAEATINQSSSNMSEASAARWKEEMHG